MLAHHESNQAAGGAAAVTVADEWDVVDENGVTVAGFRPKSASGGDGVRSDSIDDPSSFIFIPQGPTSTAKEDVDPPAPSAPM